MRMRSLVLTHTEVNGSNLQAWTVDETETGCLQCMLLLRVEGGDVVVKFLEEGGFVEVVVAEVFARRFVEVLYGCREVAVVVVVICCCCGCGCGVGYPFDEPLHFMM